MNVRATVLPWVAAIALLSVPPVSAQAPGETPLKKLTNPDPVPRRGFNVVLLLGDMQDTGGQDTIPNAARKALTDMKDFLPYKGYRLLDSQFVLASSAGPAITRLRGVDEQEYGLELRGQAAFTSGGALTSNSTSVRFVLWDASDGPAGGSSKGDGDRAANAELAAAVSREIYQLERERDDLQLRVSKGRKNVEVGMENVDEVKRLEMQLAAVTRRLADLKGMANAKESKSSGRAVIDTSFRMEDGETVVVGTSKVKGGGRALIALLTATAERAKGSTK
jgi:hypothetical protein